MMLLTLDSPLYASDISLFAADVSLDDFADFRAAYFTPPPCALLRRCAISFHYAASCRFRQDTLLPFRYA